MPTSNRDSLLFSLLVALSSFLLFLLEPMIGKQILPWFGGAAAVWATCLVFYQAALLLGYVYAARLARTRLLYFLALAASLALLPIGPGPEWSRLSEIHPIARILAMLTLSAGLPFILLSATGPLLQRHLASTGERTPYWLFVISNAASLLGLFAYPFLIEPGLSIDQQRWLWSGLYIAFAALSALALARRGKLPALSLTLTAVAPARVGLWFLLPAAGSMLLLSITNHLTANVAPVPFLWVLPLAVYLITFMLAFTDASRRRMIWSAVAISGLVLLANAIYDIDAIEPIQITVPVLLFGLFAGCMFCHSELYLRRPTADNLGWFYVAIAAGGAAGSMFVAILAPKIFEGISELPFTMFFLAALAVVVLWDRGGAQRLLWTGVAGAMTAVFFINVEAFARSSLTQVRSFYGALRVVQSGMGEHQIRTLYHGTIEHGAQFLLEPRRSRPTTYYGPDSGVGIALRECLPSPKRVGIVGLGAGTLAAYGQTGDQFDFFEINPQVETLARSWFFYLRESKATIQTEIGDARLALERDPTTRFDLLAIDAFSGDAIPVHLLTREALKLYIGHLNPGGILAFHVSNNYLDLASVVHRLAEDAGMSSALIRNHEDADNLVLASDWVLLSKNPAAFENPGLKLHHIAFSERALPVWTDGHNNLLQVLKTISVR